MKEITRIHLAKTAFSVEIDAKKSLEKYLNSIQKNMHADAEAMKEIEARMVEILAERGVMKEGVIGDDDVLAIKNQMGEPRDFSDDSEDSTDELTDDNEKPEKQLMRDTDGAVIGGVCAGIAAYFNINPLWVRLIAIVSPFVTFGTMVLVYLAMWVSMPPAKTASDKLRMRGKPVTLAALKEASADGNSTVSVRKTPIAKFFQYFVGVMVLLTTLAILFGLIVGGALGISMVDMLGGLGMQMWAWGMWTSLAIGGIAAVIFGAIVTRSIFVWKVNRMSVITMIVSASVVFMSLASVAIFSAHAGLEYARESQQLTKKVNIDIPDTTNANSIFIDMPVGNVSRINSDKFKVEAEFVDLPKANKPEINVRRDGDKIVLSVSEKCNVIFFDGCLKFYKPITGLKIYAPAGVNVSGLFYQNSIEAENSES